MANPTCTIRPMQEGDVARVGEISRDAFKSFLGIPDWMLSDADFVQSRFKTEPSGSFVAHVGEELVGAVFIVNWGTAAVCGPVIVKPRGWTGGAGGLLVETILGRAREWQTRLYRAYTFANSPKHVGFFHKLGFYPGYLSALMTTPIKKPGRAWQSNWSRLGELSGSQRDEALAAARELTGSVFEGLDVTGEMQAISAHALGDTVCVWEGSRLVGLALCHVGKHTEAGTNTCKIRFAAVRDGDEAAFDATMDASEAYAAHRGVGRLVLGINTGRRRAYQRLLTRNFQVSELGVDLQIPDVPGYNHANAFVVDDGR